MCVKDKYNILLDLREKFLKSNLYNSSYAFKNYLENFEIEYTHESTAIEGNTLTLQEVKTILDDKISVGEKSLREIYEVINHHNAFNYVKECINEKKNLNEAITKTIHNILMDNIFTGGIYRNVQVWIKGAKHKPPLPNEMYNQIKEFWRTLNSKYKNNSVKLAAYTHAEFVKIHPFEDGNGRTSRLIMNYQLLANNFLAINIKKFNRLKYYETLVEYHTTGNLESFYEMILDLSIDQYKNLLL